MSRVRCNTCNGEYDDVGVDGMRYFHACPPVPAALVQHLDGSRSIVALAKDYGTDVLIEQVSVPRLNARDENADPKLRDAKGTALPKAAGLGVTPAPKAAVPVVDVPGAA